MHHYSFHIKDYVTATAHLSNEEDLCYRRLMDLYYDSEKPIPTDTVAVARRVRVSQEIVESVLAEFFHRGDDGWHHNRCDQEIARYVANAEKNKANGMKGGRRKSPQSQPNGNPIETESEPNGNPLGSQSEPTGNPRLRQPITNNQCTPLTPHADAFVAGGEGQTRRSKSTQPDDPRFDQFWAAYPRKEAKPKAKAAFAKAHINGAFDAVMKALEAQKQSAQWQRDDGQYIPHASTWINQRRWEDQLPGAHVEKEDWI